MIFILYIFLKLYACVYIFNNTYPENTGFSGSEVFWAKLPNVRPPDWLAKDSNVLLPVVFPNTVDILFPSGEGLPPIEGGLPNPNTKIIYYYYYTQTHEYKLHQSQY